MAFVRFRSVEKNTSSTNFGTFSAGNAAIGTENSAREWLPFPLRLKEGTMHVNAAPGGGNNYTLRAQVGGVNTGGSVVLSGTDVQVRATMNADVPTASDFSLTSAQRLITNTVTGGGAPSQRIQTAWSYLGTDSGTSDSGLYAAGDDSQNITLAGTDRFIGVEWSNSSATASESLAQFPVPVAGSFKYFLVRYILAAANTMTLALRKNGGDTSMVFLLPAAAAGAGVTDLTTSVSVVPGDLMSWRFVRTSGASTSIQMIILFGFH